MALATIFTTAALARSGPIEWVRYEPEKFAQVRAAGKLVVLEFTANWCANCKFVELWVLNDPEVVAKLSESNVVAMKVDLSGPNDAGWQKLKELGSTGIPLTAVFRPKEQSPELLTSIYTSKALLNAMDGN